MSTPVSAADLAEFDLFRSLPEADLASVAKQARRRDLLDGEVLYAEGGPSTDVSLIVSGRIALRIQPEEWPVMVASLGPGDVLGWASLRPDPVALTSARASGPVQVISIAADPILDLASSGTPAGRTLIQRLIDVAAKRLARTHEQLIRHGEEAVISAG